MIPVRRSTARACLVCLGVAWSLVVPVAQEPPRQEEPQQPTFRVEANYVRVDAFVTKDGKPVTDLTAEDFEVLEDDAPQKVVAFEYVHVRGGTEPRTVRDPQTVAESRQMAADPRVRVFVVFLDTYHTGVGGSHRMRRALVTLLERILAPEDLVGFMTPEMAASEVTFGRRTESIEAMLSRYWDWGRRDRIADRDPQEDMYEICYPKNDYGTVASEMIARRREKLTLDALEDLSTFLRGVREERKAVLAVSDGWLLFRPSQTLADRGQPLPITPGGGVDSTGRLTADPGRREGSIPFTDCERDRINLSMLDNDRQFRDLFDLANRSNVSFYPIDSRGLPVFDTSLAEGVVPPSVDQAMLRNRIETLRTLALNTDGMAVVNSNDIERGLRRIADDLTSYYLLGYYSSNAALDGKFRSIKVRVKRPGVDIRARRGYRAARQDEVEAARSAATAAAANAPSNAVQREIDALGGIRGDLRVRTLAGWLPATGAHPGRRGWFVAELDPALVRSAEWTGGGVADVRLTDASGTGIASGEVTVPPGERVFSSTFDAPLEPGEYVVRVRLRPASGGLPYSDVIHFVVPATDDALGRPRLLRRGPATGLAFVATADLRYRRNERLRVEWPASAPLDQLAGELLDRQGKAMAVPVAVTAREDESGRPWITAAVELAPLAPGDYAVRVRGAAAGAPHEAVAAFRIVP